MPETEFRYGALEFRETEGGVGVVTGTIIRYGDRATFPWGTEEFKPGAFTGNYMLPIYANRMHLREEPLAAMDTLVELEGAHLRIDDNDERMFAEITLPDTTHGRNVAVEVSPSVRLLRGLSLEFRSIEDTVNEDTAHRVISKARLFGFGVVDRPAYPGSVAAMRSWAEYRLRAWAGRGHDAAAAADTGARSPAGP